MRRLTNALAFALASLATLTVAAPAAAGWLVTSDGDAIDIDGEWEVRGALVVFKQADGKLASMRLSDVDLEASAARTALPPSPKASDSARPPERRAPVMVLTDADVGHVRPSPSRAADGAGDGGEDPASEPREGPAPQPAQRAQRVVVTGWQDQVNVEAGALELTGSVANRGTHVATDTRLEVRLLDGSGELIEQRYATLGKKALGPGATSPFKVSFPGSPAYASVEFEVASRGFRARPPAD